VSIWLWPKFNAWLAKAEKEGPPDQKKQLEIVLMMMLVGGPAVFALMCLVSYLSPLK
jgi:hypothetical protein